MTLDILRKERPTASDLLRKREAEIISGYPVRELGTGEEILWLSEQEREVNVHTIGEPGAGKQV